MGDRTHRGGEMLAIRAATVAYGDTIVVKDASLQLDKGEIGCLLGPSGCGKTTLLRAIAGFESVKQGEILLNDTRVSDNSLHLAPEKRKIGMVFQDFALFPHLTITENIAFGIRHQSNTAQSRRIKQLLEMAALESFGNRYPHELSGGQQQRIALVRALAPQPDLLLLDEPFSSMDVELREGLAADIREILKQENITALFVTHDQNEAFIVADTIGVMRYGKLLQWADGYVLYHQPTSAFVADFIGQGVFIDGEVLSQERIRTSIATVSGKVPKDCPAGSKVEVFIRPDDIIINSNAALRATVINRVFRGAEFLYTLELEDQSQLLAMENSHTAYKLGEQVGITPEIEHGVVFPYRDK